MVDLFCFVLLPSNRRENVLDYKTFSLFVCLFVCLTRKLTFTEVLYAFGMELVVAVSLEKTSGQLESEKEISTTLPCLLTLFFDTSVN